jgi:hypothetical protein
MSNPALRPSCTLHTLVGYITSKTFFLQCNEYIQQVDVEKYRPAEYLTHHTLFFFYFCQPRVYPFVGLCIL